MKSLGTVGIIHGLFGGAIIVTAMENGVGFWQTVQWSFFWPWWLGKIAVLEVMLRFMEVS